VTADLRTLLHATAPDQVAEVDYEALARRGARRRITQRVVAGGAAALVLLAGVTAVVAGLDADDPAILDRPQGGVLGTWEPLPESPLSPRWEPIVVARDERVLVFRGTSFAPSGTEVGDSTFSELERQDGAIYDAGTDTWIAVPAPPTPPVAWPAVAFDGQRVAVLGGRTMTPVDGGGVYADHLGLYGERTWSAAMWEERSGWRALPFPEGFTTREPQLFTFSDGRLVVFGGAGDDQPYVDGAVWTEASGWSAIPPAPLEPRSGSAVAVVGDRLVVWGGHVVEVDDASDGLDEDETLFDDGAVYDLVTGAWAPLPPSPLAPRWLGTELGSWDANVRVDGERLLIAGGAAEGSDLPLDGAWLDLASATWGPITSAPDAARFVTQRPGGTAAVDDGGEVGVVWWYDETDDTWQRFDTDLPSGYLDVVELTAARLLVHSMGHDGQWQDSPRLAVPAASGRLVDERAPLAPRWKAAVAPLPDGALVWGGLLMRADGEAVQADQAADGVRLRLP
jgi:hypothetical protein